jgi:LuxR family maltose regulon positive regulatory protein
MANNHDCRFGGGANLMAPGGSHMSTTVNSPTLGSSTAGGTGPPTVPEQYLARPRLGAMLDAPWHVMEIQAGPGFGKTALVAHWAATLPGEVAWLDLQPAHNAPEVLAAELADKLPLAFGDMLVVLDDADNLVDSHSWELVQHLLNRHRVVLISRQATGLKLARLRSQGVVRAIHADDLRCTLRETLSLVETQLGSRMTREQVRTLWSVTRGWLAGIWLAHVAEQQFAGATTFDERHWHHWDHLLDEYFAEEALAPLPPALQEALLDVIDLPFLSDDLMLPGVSQGTLRQLIETAPFLEEDDVDPGWYRFDPLLTASLRRRAKATHAGSWPSPDRRLIVEQLLVQGRVRAAADLAQRLGDQALYLRTLQHLGAHLANMGYDDEMITWLDLPPGQSTLGIPDLDFWWMAARLNLGRTHGVAERLATVEVAWQATGDPLQIGRLHLVHGVLAFHEGRSTEALESLQAARAILPPMAEVERLQAETFEGRQLTRLGHDELAIEPLAAAEQTLRRRPIVMRWGWRTVAVDRANTYAIRGDLPSAQTKLNMMLAELPPGMPDVEGFLRCRLLAVQVERDQLAEAELNYEHIDDLLGMERLQWRSGIGVARVQAILADRRGQDAADWRHDAVIARLRLWLVQGEADLAERVGADYLKRVRYLPHKEQIVLMLAYLWLERREWPMVQSWLRDLGSSRWPWVKSFGDINPTMLSIDLNLAQGNLAEAMEQARKLVTDAAQHLRWSEYLAGQVRLGLVRDLAGDPRGAHTALQEAARIGVRGGFHRAFRVPGWDLPTHFGPRWRACGLPQPPARSAVPTLVEEFQLTHREIEVLELVAQGKSNKQIAMSLFISVNTVRNHLVRISRRLDAGSRTEVVAKARRAGLLG